MEKIQILKIGTKVKFQIDLDFISEEIEGEIIDFLLDHIYVVRCSDGFLWDVDINEKIEKRKGS
ncbi:MAG: hypothetical protein ACRC0V_05170 [Fusobacteriaceae bacterium]